MTSRNKISLAVIHYPVYDKNREIVATSVTNVAIHDIARTCMTFGIEICYIVTPLPKQRDIVGRLIDHWTSGYGARYNPDRGRALNKVQVVDTVERILEEHGDEEPLLIGTSSRERKEKTVGYRELQAMIRSGTRPIILVFGTGWGLTDDVVEKCHRMLAPIKGDAEYNHLSLRVALGITLDRIFGQ